MRKPAEGNVPALPLVCPDAMNKTIRRASVFTLLLVFALLVRATWVQFYDGRALADDRNNRRNAIETYAEPLGNIIVAGESVTGSARTKEATSRTSARTRTDRCTRR
ncbi:hypothetical protein SHKM778_68390 [Streptomyces sp. KM77-8]|uniref:Uncharacterized protein n=1 Tax=Streptomyces haneummycinicus TaxID=3074435 RepID=A0AAT9HS81_9ACTN